MTSIRTPFGFLLHALLLLMLAFILAPLLIVVAMSFSDSFMATFPPEGFTFKWYAQVLQNEKFTASLRLSAGLALLATLGSLLLGIPAAIALSRGKVWGGGLITSLLLSPLIFPTMIIGLSLLQLLNSAGSSQVLLNLWLGHVVITVPYVIRNVVSSLQMVDGSLEDAARTLGASSLQTFWRVTLPQIAPGVAAGALFAFMISFEDYPISMWFADAEFMPAPLFLMKEMSITFDPSITAMSTVIVVVALLAVSVLDRLVGVRRVAKV